MKTGKEIKINTYKNFNVSVGSVNYKKSKSVYLSVSSWCEPQTKGEYNFLKVIKNITKKFKQDLYNQLSCDSETIFLKDRTIIDVDLKDSGMRYGKRSFMNCEITLFLNTETSLTSEKLLKNVNNLLNFIIDDTLERDALLSFHKTKK